eukprot:TRINITY_DN120799_c0_g1_i1.p1 TRINITY_DN120799_c0_g1~~TRINITY_DN120799_c0_g1_i1.p1  ORF type:complete len:460 (+),score=32.38 TRINITY_DN120799_c0_g1_i1:91-1470(+)
MPPLSTHPCQGHSGTLQEEPPGKPVLQTLEAWSAFSFAISCALGAQVVELYVTCQLYQEGEHSLAFLMIAGLLYSRVSRAYRGIAGYTLHTDKVVDACADFFGRPTVLLPAFFRLDEVKAQYDAMILGRSKVKAASLVFTTVISESMLQLYLKCIALMRYWKRSDDADAFRFMLVSTIVCVWSTSTGMLQFELVLGKENGYMCPPCFSAYGVYHFMTRTSELVGRCLSVAAFVVFFPFPVVAAAILIAEEVLIMGFVILAKAVQAPAFFSTMNRGRCGALKRYTYMLVVIWPMYMCVHTQRYIDATPQPVFSYKAYYSLRIGFTWARACLLTLVLRLHVCMDLASIAKISCASLAGTLVWMGLFPTIREMSAAIKDTKMETDVEAFAVVPRAAPSVAQTASFGRNVSNCSSCDLQAEKEQVNLCDADACESPSHPHQSKMLKSSSGLLLVLDVETESSR